MSAAKLFPLGSMEAKLNPPAPGSAQVPRRQLIDMLCASRNVRLVVVRAPAGFGKTSVMQQYKHALDAMKLRTAWVTLDRADNDITRFLQCVASAMAGMLRTPIHAKLDNDSLLAPFTQLWQIDKPFVLFLDEYEVIQEGSIHDIVRQIIDDMPRGSQVVIASRNVPGLALGRMRARGQMLEINADQLRFSLNECQEYLTVKRALALTAPDVQRLHGKTEGWIAGLWLASTALARHQDASDLVSRFSGASLEVADYLSEDVLNLQAPEVRDFLLKTSVLRELSPALCQALVPELDADAVMRKLEDDNILITRMAGSDRSYRYHSLFASFLRTRLAREHGQQIPLLHSKASAWFATQNRPVPAIEHALEGGNLDSALDMLEAHAPSLLRAGRLRLLIRWFDAIPEAMLARRPLLCLLCAWTLCLTRGSFETMAFLARNPIPDDAAPAVRRSRMAMQAILHSLMDQPEQAYAIGMDNLPSPQNSDPFSDPALLAVLADVCSAKNQPVEALRMVDRLRALEEGSIGAINDMHSQTAEGTIALFEGRMREATVRFRIAVSATLPPNTNLTGGSPWAGILYAASVYEGDDLEQAGDLLRVYVPLARQVGLPDQVIIGYRILARIAFSSGEVDHAFQLLADLESIGHERHLLRVVASARLERARVQLLQGHLQSARDELERASDAAIWTPFAQLRLPANDVDYPQLARWRWEAMAGDPHAAIAGLETEWREARDSHRFHRALKLRLLKALAHKRADEAMQATAALDETLRDCRQEGFVRLIVDEGMAVSLLVKDAFDRHRLGSAQRDDAHLVWLQRLLQAFGPLPVKDASQAPPKPADAYMADPLTRKELKVLHLLAEGYSNQAMADKLQISLNTVRTHMRSIHSKLGVQSRLQAVSAGRAFGLLP